MSPAIRTGTELLFVAKLIKKNGNEEIMGEKITGTDEDFFRDEGWVKDGCRLWEEHTPLKSLGNTGDLRGWV